MNRHCHTTATTLAIDKARSLAAVGMPATEIALRVPLTPYVLALALQEDDEAFQAEQRLDALERQVDSHRRSRRLGLVGRHRGE